MLGMRSSEQVSTAATAEFGRSVTGVASHIVPISRAQPGHLRAVEKAPYRSTAGLHLLPSMTRGEKTWESEGLLQLLQNAAEKCQEAPNPEVASCILAVAGVGTVNGLRSNLGGLTVTSKISAALCTSPMT